VFGIKHESCRRDGLIKEGGRGFISEIGIELVNDPRELLVFERRGIGDVCRGRFSGEREGENARARGKE
jgi:hypothetical protein